MTYYSMKATHELIDQLTGMGFEMVTLSDGVLGYGEIVMIAPDNSMFNYHIVEVYLNEWASAYTIRRMSRIGAKMRKRIDEAWDRIAHEAALEAVSFIRRYEDAQNQV